SSAAGPTFLRTARAVTCPSAWPGYPWCHLQTCWTSLTARGNLSSTRSPGTCSWLTLLPTPRYCGSLLSTTVPSKGARCRRAT
ncbi:unnamed protein product, partial [Ectocarpus sp. 12 AP-2014]